MTKSELSKLIKYGESQTVSSKALRSKPSTLARPVASFSNTNDGLLIVGVDDKTRKIHGAKTTKQREEAVIQLRLEYKKKEGFLLKGRVKFSV